MIAGYRPEVDQLEHAQDKKSQIAMVRVTRREDSLRLVKAMPVNAFYAPWPEEFLWVEVHILDTLYAWWSLTRDFNYDRSGCLVSSFQTKDGFGWDQLLLRDLVNDTVAFNSYHPAMIERFIISWHYATVQGRNST